MPHASSSRFAQACPNALGFGGVRGFDALQVNGFAFELAGDPWPVVNPRTGKLSHLELRAVRLDGAAPLVRPAPGR